MLGEYAEWKPTTKYQKTTLFAEPSQDSGVFFRKLKTDQLKDRRTDTLVDALKDWVDNENKKACDEVNIL